MSDIGVVVNGVLSVLLVAAMALGWRLERRLRALRGSHEDFLAAVADLDQAAARVERGLEQMKLSAGRAPDTLGARIQQASQLAARLERLTADARKEAPPPTAPDPRAGSGGGEVPDAKPVSAPEAVVRFSSLRALLRRAGGSRPDGQPAIDEALFDPPRPAGQAIV